MAKGHPKVGWAPIGFAVAAPCTNLLAGKPLSALQQCQPHDPLNITLNIAKFVRYLYTIYKNPIIKIILFILIYIINKNCIKIPI